MINLSIYLSIYQYTTTNDFINCYSVKTKNTRILLFLINNSTVKIEIVRYYLLRIFATLEYSNQKYEYAAVPLIAVLSEKCYTRYKILISFVQKKINILKKIVGVYLELILSLPLSLSLSRDTHTHTRTHTHTYIYIYIYTYIYIYRMIKITSNYDFFSYSILVKKLIKLSIKSILKLRVTFHSPCICPFLFPHPFSSPL